MFINEKQIVKNILSYKKFRCSGLGIICCRYSFSFEGHQTESIYTHINGFDSKYENFNTDQ